VLPLLLVLTATAHCLYYSCCLSLTRHVLPTWAWIEQAWQAPARSSCVGWQPAAHLSLSLHQPGAALHAVIAVLLHAAHVAVTQGCPMLLLLLLLLLH
jgi:hypothetical protein